MEGKVKCTCGWSWNKSDSSKKDMYICHECGRDNSNNMQNGGWLDSYDKAQDGIISPNVSAQDQYLQEKNKENEEYEKLIGNTGEELIDFGQRFIPGLRNFPAIGSTFAVGEAEANNQNASLSDELGMIPNPYAQATSLMLLYAEKEKENFQKFAENRDRNKTYNKLVREEELNPKVIDNTYIPKPKIGELKENKFKTKEKKIPYKEKKEINKVQIDNTYVAKPRLKNGDWLDSYADGGTMQEHQENYNDSQASAPEGMLGDGFSNVGRNYSPAWGGSFQMGGNIYPVNYVPQAQDGLQTVSSRQKRGLDLLIKETKKAEEDKKELQTTGQIKNPRSIHYKKLTPKQSDLKTQTKSNEELEGQLVLERPLVYLANPEKLLGDIGVPGMETSELDRQAVMANRFNPNQSRLNRFTNNVKIGAGYVPEATVNTAMAAAFMPEGSGALGLVNEALNPLAGLSTNIAPELRQGLRTAGSSINNIGKKSIITDLKQGLANFNPKNLKSDSGLDWMKQWYEHPDFARRYNTTGEYSAFSMQNHILDQLNEYKPKNYLDLLKDKGVKEYINKSITSGGVSWGVPESIYHNRTMYGPFGKKGLESTKTHELTHLIENNGNFLSVNDQNSLLKPFGYNTEEIFGQALPPNKLLGRNKSYYLDPTEIHARMNQSRFELGLSPEDKFTEEMFDVAMKKNEFNGMGKYIKDKKGFTDLMNNFWAVPPAVIGAGAFQQTNQEETPQMKKGGVIKDDRGQWAHPGEITEIGSNQITMQGVPYDVLGISDTGDTKLMKPGKDYKFKGKKVTEYPMAKNGVNQQDQKTFEQLDQLTNFTNYNKPTIGGWLNKYN